MNNSDFIKLFAQCIIVEGAKNKIICDLQRNDYYVLNQGIHEILTMYSHLTVGEIKSKYDVDFHEIIEDNLNKLAENDLIFFTKNIDHFPDIKKEYSNPNKITNAIINVSSEKQNLATIFPQLSDLGCFFIEFRITFSPSSDFLQNTLTLLNESCIRNVNLSFSFNEKLDTTFINELLINFQRIGQIIIYNTPNDLLGDVREQTDSNVYFIEDPINFEKCCGVVNESMFVSGIELFMESQKHNSCLNRKITIDADGSIKNCPSMPQSFGNINDNSLAEVIEKPGFKKYWTINKDKIHVCKDCEFRYICTDCRAFVEDPKDILSKPLKCGYNPYTGEWNDWSVNPLNQKVIDFYNLKEVIDEMKKLS